MKKVVKFGGSSLASAKQFKKVGEIIRSDKARRYVVPSAPGKRSKTDEKVTDMLYACYDAASTGASYGKIFSKIKERYEQIIEGLGLNLNLDFEFKKIEENFIAKKGRDYAASRGEYLNGIVMASVMNLSMRRKRYSLMITEIFWLTKRIRNYPSVLNISTVPLSRAFTAPNRTEPLKPFQEAAQTSQAPL